MNQGSSQVSPIRRAIEHAQSLLQVVQRAMRDRRAQEFSLNALLTLAVYAAAMAAEKLIVTPYLARRLDDATFGAFLLGRNATLVISGGIYSGIYNLLLRHNLEWEQDEKATVVVTAGALSLFLSVGASTLTLLTIWAHGGASLIRENWLPFCAFSVWGGATTFTYVLQTYWRMKFRMVAFNLLQLFIGFCALFVLPFFVWDGMRGLYFGLMAAGVVPLIATLALVVRETIDSPARLWRTTEAAEILRRMWVFVWGTVTLSLLQYLDRFVIGWLLGSSAVGFYFKATSAAYLITVPVEPLAGLILSMAAQGALGEQTGKFLRWLHLLILAMMGGLCLVGLVFGPAITDWLYGVGTYRAGRMLYLIILFGCSLSIISTLLRGMLIVHAPTRWIVAHDTVGLIFLTTACLILVSSYGLIGAAAAVALTMVVRAVMSEMTIRLTWRRRHAASKA